MTIYLVKGDIYIDIMPPPTRSNSTSKAKTTDEKLEEIHGLLADMITKEYMDRKILRLKEDIKKEYREITERLEGRMFDLEKENERLGQRITHLEERDEEMDDDRQEVKKETKNRLNDLEQHGRKNSVRIFGLEDTARESVEECVDKVVGFVNDRLSLNVQNGDIDIAHRLGKFTGERPRSIIVKFTHRRTKHNIIKARKGLKGSGYTIFEDLTKLNQQKLKDAYKLKSVSNSYSLDGKLFLVLDNGKKRQITIDTPLTEKFLYTDSNFAKKKRDDSDDR